MAKIAATVAVLLLFLCSCGADAEQETQKQPVLQSVMDFLQCNLCDTKVPEGRVSDCQCDFRTVDQAVQSFYVPLLTNITRSAYFRYFRVDLEGECPFWSAPNQCAMEKCSVCPCDDAELPKSWVEATTDHVNQEGATIENPYVDGAGEQDLGRVLEGGKGPTSAVLRELESRGSSAMPASLWGSVGEGEGSGWATSDARGAAYASSLQRDVEDDPYDWIDLAEDEDDFCMPQLPDTRCSGGEGGGYTGDYKESELSGGREGARERGVYVNLLNNPERYTGYRGESATRVWQAITEENCFSPEGAADVCLEKRTFHRLMSGLRASITTHVAREFYFHDADGESGHWGVNVPMFVQAVGRFPERLDNLYFTFLFLLRAVGRLQHVMPLLLRELDTGSPAEDAQVAALVRLLVVSAEDNAQANALSNSSAASTFYHDFAHNISSTSSNSGFGTSSAESPKNSAIEQCRVGFDETHLFQVPASASGPQYWSQVQEKAILLKEFRLRFRNITRIMNCVTCEKCKLWGKLQILGLGTAIKVLLLSEEDLQMAATEPQTRAVLNRQELIALVNTLHQIARSVEFAQSAVSLELEYKLGSLQGLWSVVSEQFLLLEPKSRLMCVGTLVLVVTTLSIQLLRKISPRKVAIDLK